MAFVAVDFNNSEWVFSGEPVRSEEEWIYPEGVGVILPTGSIAKLIGRELTWECEPVELEEYNFTNYARMRAEQSKGTPYEWNFDECIDQVVSFYKENPHKRWDDLIDEYESTNWY